MHLDSCEACLLEGYDALSGKHQVVYQPEGYTTTEDSEELWLAAEFLHFGKHAPAAGAKPVQKPASQRAQHAEPHEGTECACKPMPHPEAAAKQRSARGCTTQKAPSREPSNTTSSGSTSAPHEHRSTSAPDQGGPQPQQQPAQQASACQPQRPKYGKTQVSESGSQASTHPACHAEHVRPPLTSHGLGDDPGSSSQACGNAAHSSRSEQVAFEDHAGQDCAHHAAAVVHSQDAGGKDVTGSSKTVIIPPGDTAKGSDSSHVKHKAVVAASAGLTSAPQPAPVQPSKAATLAAPQEVAANKAAGKLKALGRASGKTKAKAAAATAAVADVGKAAEAVVIPELAGDSLAEPFSQDLSVLPPAPHPPHADRKDRAPVDLPKLALGLKRSQAISKAQHAKKGAAGRATGPSKQKVQEASGRTQSAPVPKPQGNRPGSSCRPRAAPDLDNQESVAAAASPPPADEMRESRPGFAVAVAAPATGLPAANGPPLRCMGDALPPSQEDGIAGASDIAAERSPAGRTSHALANAHPSEKSQPAVLVSESRHSESTITASPPKGMAARRNSEITSDTVTQGRPVPGQQRMERSNCTDASQSQHAERLPVSRDADHGNMAGDKAAANVVPGGSKGSANGNEAAPGPPNQQGGCGASREAVPSLASKDLQESGRVLVTAKPPHVLVPGLPFSLSRFRMIAPAHRDPPWAQ